MCHFLKPLKPTQKLGQKKSYSSELWYGSCFYVVPTLVLMVLISGISIPRTPSTPLPLKLPNYIFISNKDKKETVFLLAENFEAKLILNRIVHVS